MVARHRPARRPPQRVGRSPRRRHLVRSHHSRRADGEFGKTVSQLTRRVFGRPQLPPTTKLADHAETVGRMNSKGMASSIQIPLPNIPLPSPVRQWGQVSLCSELPKWSTSISGSMLCVRCVPSWLNRFRVVRIFRGGQEHAGSEIGAPEFLLIGVHPWL